MLDLQKKNQDLSKQLDEFKAMQAKHTKSQLLSAVRAVNSINFIAEKVDLPPDSIKNISFELKNEIANLYMVLGTDHGGKANISVALSDNLIQDKGLNAGSIVRELAKQIQGGGGGQAFFCFRRR